MALEIAKIVNSIRIKDTVSGNLTFIPVNHVTQVNFTGLVSRPRVGSFPNSNNPSKYVVNIRVADGSKFTVPLGGDPPAGNNNVSNQATWVDTSTGAIAAVTDINAMLTAIV